MKEVKREERSDFSFKIMRFSFFDERDKLCPPVRLPESFGIKPGMTVVDCGCGPGSHSKAASGLTGDKGQVYGVDANTLAVESVSRLIRDEKLTNVTSVLSEKSSSCLKDDKADFVFALGMVHMIRGHWPVFKRA
ncbi:cyclopropane fatty-acyl-phospholipid synthase-like methyltransferase [Methanomicrobium sp. W14]|uniref:methyltransferase domain-containing protein n=1 Tax=Methanomicrobium sp. W14 TaxID=2817839 RepID=UPI001AE13437|nr:methyltransferase domain-containing protein [Methanomicrobium sp. W14]MBP2132500.1 cyclopropane fatty-acyl-phospholipid synthase-like methyltransferase [Methanomicrobium sp. W14]